MLFHRSVQKENMSPQQKINLEEEITASQNT